MYICTQQNKDIQKTTITDLNKLNMKNYQQEENKYMKKIAFTAGFIVGVALCLLFVLILLMNTPC